MAIFRYYNQYSTWEFIESVSLAKQSTQIVLIQAGFKYGSELIMILKPRFADMLH
jgi:hypothetical protein